MPDLPGCVAGSIGSPPEGRAAVTAYWRRHPLRAHRFALASAARIGPPNGWTWEAMSWNTYDWRRGQQRTTAEHRYRDPPLALEWCVRRFGGPGRCTVCGWPVYRWGWHEDLSREGPNTRANWHAACVEAYMGWTAPRRLRRFLVERQGGVCPVSGESLHETTWELDHIVPLWRVWRDHRDTAWPAVLEYWGPGNLQVLSRAGHRQKSAEEARERADLVAQRFPVRPA